MWSKTRVYSSQITAILIAILFALPAMGNKGRGYRPPVNRTSEYWRTQMRQVEAQAREALMEQTIKEYRWSVGEGKTTNWASMDKEVSRLSTLEREMASANLTDKERAEKEKEADALREQLRTNFQAMAAAMASGRGEGQVKIPPTVLREVERLAPKDEVKLTDAQQAEVDNMRQHFRGNPSLLTLIDRSIAEFILRDVSGSSPSASPRALETFLKNLGKSLIGIETAEKQAKAEKNKELDPLRAADPAESLALADPKDKDHVAPASGRAVGLPRTAEQIAEAQRTLAEEVAYASRHASQETMNNLFAALENATEKGITLKALGRFIAITKKARAEILAKEPTLTEEKLQEKAYQLARKILMGEEVFEWERGKKETRKLLGLPELLAFCAANCPGAEHICPRRGSKS